MAGSWELPMITPVASGGKLADKTLYKTLTRLSSDYTDYAKFFIWVLQNFNWTDIAFIRGEGHIVYDLQENTFLPFFEKAGIRTTVIRYTPGIEYKAVLEAASQVARGKRTLLYANMGCHVISREAMIT